MRRSRIRRCRRRRDARALGSRAVSRIVVIGATGHVGTYLVPRLVRAGHEVVALSRGEREPYLPAAEWRSGRAGHRRPRGRGRRRACSASGSRRSAPTPSSTWSASRRSRRGSSWRRCARRGRCWCTAARSGCTARPHRVPVTEDEPRTAYGEYGTGKAAIEALLHRETLAGGVPSVVLHPGHISRARGRSITPAGNLDLDVWRRLATGEPLRAARARARRAAPRARRRRRPGLRAGADPPGRDRRRASTSSPSRR